MPGVERVGVAAEGVLSLPWPVADRDGFTGQRFAGKQDQPAATSPSEQIKEGYPVVRQHPLLDSEAAGVIDHMV
jgi:hypothetical protein